MKPLREALPELAHRVRAAGRVALFLDFDGTLAPIVARPEQARLDTATRDRLRSLSASASVSIAIVSGRAMEDLRSRVHVPGIAYAANHGLEIQSGGTCWIHSQAAALRDQLRGLCGRIANELRRFPAAVVEYKGLTATIHYRAVPVRHHPPLRAAVRRAIAACPDGFLTRAGLQSLEIRPDLAWDKGCAVRLLLARWGIPKTLAFCFGDDNTDEDAFAALPEGVTVLVGPQRRSAAKYRVRNPAEVDRFLGWLWLHAPRPAAAEAS